MAALKRRLEFSLGNVTSVSTEPHGWWEGLRLPGVIKEGRYIASEKRGSSSPRGIPTGAQRRSSRASHMTRHAEMDDKEAVARELSR